VSDKVKLCSCGFDALELQAWSVEWHEAHKPYHLEVFPGVADDQITLDNLDSFIARARRKASA
jgi:hypothetical protein